MLESTVLACMEVVVEGAEWLGWWAPLMLRGEEGTGGGGCPCGGWWLALSQQLWQLPQAAACSAMVSLSSHVLQIGALGQQLWQLPQAAACSAMVSLAPHVLQNGTLGLPVDRVEPGRSEDDVGAAVQSGSWVGAVTLVAL